MNHKKLLNVCQKALATFRPDIESADDRLQLILDENPKLDSTDESFIEEVFTGCTRYQALLTVTVDNFYLGEGSKLLLKDTYLFRIMAYLAMLRLHDLGFDNFETFILSEDPLKMHTFLKYLFDEPKLKSWLLRKWCEIYDERFILDSVLPNITDHLHPVQKLVSRLQKRLDNTTSPRKAVQVTQPIPFNLTEVKPRAVPLPEPLATVKPVNPVPSSTYKAPRETLELSRKREDQRRKSERMLKEVRSMSSNLTRTGRSLKAQERMDTIVRETEAALKFESHKAKPVPRKVLQDNSYPIKLNAATILREDALYAKKEEQELKKLVSVLTGEGTDTKHQAWRAAKEEEDRRAETEKQLKRRMMGLLSYEEALLAKQKLTEINRIKVAKMKKEADLMLKEFLVEQLREEEVAREKVVSVQDCHERTKVAQQQLLELKRQMVLEVHAESKELMRIAVAEAAEEMEKKRKLISEIRAFDRTPVSTAKLVDLTSTAGFGFLCEMSIVELKERLVLEKESRQRELEERRGDIIAEKVSYKKMLEDKLSSISHNRQLVGRESAARIAERHRVRTAPVVVQSPELDHLQRKLAEKRSERIKLKETQRSDLLASSNNKRNMNIVAQKRELEERRWRDLESTRERMARMKTTALST